MEVFVSAPGSRSSLWMFPDGSVVGDIVDRFVQQQGVSSSVDFYVVRDGRLSDQEDGLQPGAIYHLETRLCGGKGGFGSMLRALGAQIEKTTNREACRDLSGRRLRDVNHEKEMAEWLKKQAEREAEKEQRRLERLQRKLSEPKHQFTDPQYQQQCHDLSERLEDSVIKGLQASCSSQVNVDVFAVKRPNSDHSEPPPEKKKKKMAGCFWTGLDELLSSEDEDSEEEEDFPSTSSAVNITAQQEEAEPEKKSSSSSADQTPRDQTVRPSEDQRPAETSRDQTVRPSEDQRPAETSRDQTVRPSEDQRPAETSRDQTIKPSEDQSPSQQQVDLSSVSSPGQLESLGLDVLKEELMRRGLKCGGTLSERAARLFSIRGLNQDQIDPALLAKPAKTKKK